MGKLAFWVSRGGGEGKADMAE